MTKKILASVLVTVFMLTLGVTPVLAQPPKKPEMGPTTIAVDFIYADVDTYNFGSVRNYSMVGANTGLNLTSSQKAVVDTGNAKAGTETTTGLNDASVEGIITDSHMGPVALNMEAGHHPLAVAADFIYVDVDNVNKGGVCNFSVANANTGLNTTGKKGDVTTGDAEAKNKIDSTVNTSETKITVEKTVNGPMALNLEMEGGEADLLGGGRRGFSHGKTALAVDFNMVDVENLNFGHVGNMSFASANTGMNSTGKKSEVETGKALASTGTTTNLNKIDNTVSVSDTGLVGPVAVNFEYKEECGGRGGRGGRGKEKSLAVALSANAVLIDNLNMGRVSNLSMANANTGLNVTGDKATVNTGKAAASTLTDTTVNTISNNITVSSTSNGPIAVNAEVEQEGGQTTGGCLHGVGCGETVGPVAANIGTSGTAVAVDAAVVAVDNVNVGEVTNTSVANANTGGNVTGCGPVPGPCNQSVNSTVCTSDCDPTPAPAGETSVTTGNATAETTTTTTVNTSSTTFTINH